MAEQKHCIMGEGSFPQPLCCTVHPHIFTLPTSCQPNPCLQISFSFTKNVERRNRSSLEHGTFFYLFSFLADFEMGASEEREIPVILKISSLGVNVLYFMAYFFMMQCLIFMLLFPAEQL